MRFHAREIPFVCYLGSHVIGFLISAVVFGFYYFHQCYLSLTSVNLNILFFGFCVHRYYCNFRRKKK